MLPQDHARFLQETERARIVVNQEVVRLLKEKTVPLNKARYVHLQKISKAVSKESPLVYASSAQLTLNLQPLSLLSPLAHPRASSTRNRPMFVAELLLKRLSTINTHQNASHPELNAQHSTQNMRSRILQTEMPKSQLKRNLKTPKSQGRRRQQDLLELAEKAQEYLRVKKRDLKERHTKDIHPYQNKKKGGANQITTTFHSLKKQSKMTEKILQRELLQDFREQMFQAKMNRMKRQINHRKIVQLR